MESPPRTPGTGLDGVATADLGRLHSPAVCGHCGREIPRPRVGQKACSSRCRWALRKAGRQETARRQRARDEEVRALLEAALRKLEEGSP